MQILAQKTKNFIVLPSKEDIQETMISAFKIHYPNCRVIIVIDFQGTLFFVLIFTLVFELEVIQNLVTYVNTNRHFEKTINIAKNLIFLYLLSRALCRPKRHGVGQFF